VRTPVRRTQRMPNSETRDSWNGAGNVYSNVSETTSQASSENECWFLGELVAGGTQKLTEFGNFRPVSVTNRKNELSSTRNPSKTSFAGLPIERAPTQGRSSGYPAYYR